MTFSGIEKLKNAQSVEQINAEILSNMPVSRKDLEAEGVFIFGVGKLGQRVYDFLRSANIRVNAFVDNNPEKQKADFNGLKVIPSSALKSESIVYIASATYFNPIYKQLLKQGVTRCFSHPQSGILFFDEPGFPTEMYQENLTQDLFHNKDNYLRVFDLLQDTESQRVFDHLLLFRLTLNQKYIDAIHTHIEKEYFDSSVIQLNDHEVFFDVGGFDGDSAENFVKFVNARYQSVHIFEPDQGLLDKAKVRLKEYQNIEYNALGIYDKSTTLYFDVTGGLDGNISTTGTVSIKTITIDEYDKADPTYIKYDVEGVEIEAINGAEATIKNKRPKLAVASYHYPKHIWEIPLLIMQMNPTYKVQLRHYTDSVFDSIFYFT